MQVSLLSRSKDDLNCTLVLKGISTAYANSIRRSFIENVPVLAIEDVEIRKNNSALYDEIIAHRLGLIPLKTDIKTYEQAPDNYKNHDELNIKQKVTLTLKAKGPGMVYASDIKSSDPSVKPVQPKMPIVNLLQGQELEFEAIAIVSVGRIHAKWSPCLSYYRLKPVIEINKKVENAKEVIEKQPDKIFILKNNNLVVDSEKILLSNLVEEAVSLCKPNGTVKLNYAEDEIIFSIESWGQLTCKEIVEEGLKQISLMCDDFIKALK
ncbi:MAG: DNA-directed RNA polymerase subunit D [Candidatus Woesearchaeota archaeon]